MQGTEVCIQRLLTARKSKENLKEGITSCYYYYKTPGQFSNLQVRCLTGIAMQGYSNVSPTCESSVVTSLQNYNTADAANNHGFPKRKHGHWTENTFSWVLLNTGCIYLHSRQDLIHFMVKFSSQRSMANIQCKERWAYTFHLNMRNPDRCSFHKH